MKTDKDLPNIPALLDHVACDFCENYCKWPGLYDKEGQPEHKLYDDHCNSCPVNSLT